MCRRITLKICGKPTYTGCGKHMEQALIDFLPEHRCSCPKEVE